MKVSIVLAALLSVLFCQAQGKRTEHIDSNGLLLPESELHRYHPVHKIDMDTLELVEYAMPVPGKPRRKMKPPVDSLKTHTGQVVHYFENGQVAERGYCERGLYHGKWEGFYESGQPYYEEEYKNGKRVKAVYFNRNGEEVPEQSVHWMPQYSRGEKAMYQFLASQLRYPLEAKDAGAEGIVLAQLVVAKDGTLVNVVILRSAHPALDAEVIEVLKSFPPWRPGIEYGTLTEMRYNMPFKFTLL